MALDSAASTAPLVDEAERPLSGAAVAANAGAAIAGMAALVPEGSVEATTAKAGPAAAAGVADSPPAAATFQFGIPVRRFATERRRLLLATLLALPLVATPLLQADPRVTSGWPPVLLAALLLFGVAAPLCAQAWQALLRGRATSTLLVVIAATAALALASWRTHVGADATLEIQACTWLVLSTLCGEWLRVRGGRRRDEALRALAALRPGLARVHSGASTREVASDSLHRGDRIVVRAGERFPADGRVLTGCTQVDESQISGEPLPVPKEAGDIVTGGAINGEGELLVHITAAGADTLLARTIARVDAARAARPSVAGLADRVGAAFVPFAIAFALLTAIGWGTWTGEWSTGVQHAIAVLAIACPCALGLAIPLTLYAGVAAARQHGIRVRDVAALEAAYRIDAVALDKTGTVTTGRPNVVAMHALEGDERALLAQALSLQRGSAHPLARAVLEEAIMRGITAMPALEVQPQHGLGVVGRIAGRRHAFGSARLLAEYGVATDALAQAAETHSAAGRSVAWLAELEPAPRLLGLFGFGDRLRDGALPAITALRDAGVMTVLITGDNRRAAHAVAHELGLRDVHAEVLPDAKAATVEELKRAGWHVAMVGDGVNDAPALAAADLGIAMASGTDFAMYAAAITLTHDDPRLIPTTLELARQVRRAGCQNLALAFATSTACLPLAAFGVLDARLAALAMAVSTVAVFANALRLRFWRPRLQAPLQRAPMMRSLPTAPAGSGGPA